MQVKFKKLNDSAVAPKYADNGAAGLDLIAISKEKKYHPEYGYLMYTEMKTGIAIEIPDGYVGFLFPRSSISNYTVTLANSVGVLDASFRGEITLRFKTAGSVGIGEYNVGDKIGQLVIVPIPQIELSEVDELSNTSRGTSGWGSSGN